jgi:Domain of unknown function (DUF5664)
MSTSNGVDSGAAPDAPVIANAKGGMQSKLEGRYDLIPGEALVRLANVVGLGARKYAVNNWRAIEYEAHLNHALMHLVALMNGDRSDDHLGHALCRLAFAVATEDPDHDFKRVTVGLAATELVPLTVSNGSNGVAQSDITVPAAQQRCT